MLWHHSIVWSPLRHKIKMSWDLGSHCQLGIVTSIKEAMYSLARSNEIFYAVFVKCKEHLDPPFNCRTSSLLLSDCFLDSFSWTEMNKNRVIEKAPGHHQSQPQSQPAKASQSQPSAGQSSWELPKRQGKSLRQTDRVWLSMPHTVRMCATERVPID